MRLHELLCEYDKEQAFRNWFGNSKVVDSSGNPLVVYHGTVRGGYVDTVDIEAFDLERVGDRYGADEAGFFFTSSTKEADYYATTDSIGNTAQGAVYPVYLSLQNPLVITPEEIASSRVASDTIGYWDGNIDDILGRAIGYDGVILDDGDTQMYVAFNPNQIKSAVGNKGIYDPSNPNINEMTLYHGSPHKFDRFDHAQMGTGEGSQAYGWGTYLAENPEVAKSYSEMALRRSKGIRSATDEAAYEEFAIAQQYARRHRGDNKVAASFLERVIEGNDAKGGWSKVNPAEDRATHVRALGRLRSNTLEPSDVNLYEVDLPDEAIAKMLDWDAPLSKQPEIVQILNDALIGPYYDDLTGQDYVRNLARRLHPMGGHNYKQASEEMLAVGIPGIKYYDGGSRSAGKGTRNFVIFDANLITIISRNGVAV